MGQREEELALLRGWSPEQESALVRGAALPERLAEFRRSRDGEEARLQGQITSAQHLANSPMNMNTNSTPAAVAAIVSNALRSFGGMALADRGEGQLKNAQAESRRQYEELMGLADQQTKASIDTKRQGLQNSLPDALRGWQGVPWQ